MQKRIEGARQMKRGNGRSHPARRHRVYFTIQAPEAREVVLCGTFTNWEKDSRPLKKDKQGIWKGWLMLGPGAYEYRFLVDGNWRNDPEASTVPNPFGTSNCLQIVH
jgi:1,4-alpha-glucan branching enzyme